MAMEVDVDVDGGKSWDGEEDWGMPPKAAPGKVSIVIKGAPPEPYVLSTLASLILGSTLEGSEQLSRRLKQWQAKAENRASQPYSEKPDESEGERLRYALIGLFSKTPDVTQSVFSTAMHASDSVYGFLSNALSPVTNSRVMRPVQRRYDNLAARGATIVEQWIRAGRIAEQRSRALARQVAVEGTDEGIDEVIGLLAQKPEVRELVTQQSFGMADEVALAIRQRSAAADTQWERRVRALFGRR